MKKRMKAVALALVVAGLSMPLLAGNDSKKSEALERQIEALQARVAALEARQTFTSFMPDLAERFHVMHRAGLASDWAMASHELEEMKRLTRLSTSVDADKGKLMQAMMKASFEALDTAIEHNDDEKFRKALAQTIDSCNACHAATGSPFVQVTLDARDSLSIRHPHKFSEREVAAGHAHGDTPAESATGEHDDTGKAKHND